MASPQEEMTIEEPKPIQAQPKSNLDLVNECDNFPYYQVDPAAYLRHVEHYYALRVSEYPELDLGFMLPSVAEVFRGLAGWKVDDKDRSLILVSDDDEAVRSNIIATTTEAMRRTDHFAILKGWRDELYPVYGPNKKLLFSIERAASALFGVVTYGCHLTAYVRQNGELKIWVARRAKSKQTYGGMLDNAAAGGLATGETPRDCMVREAAEEASLAEAVVQKSLLAAGTVTYFHIRDERAGGETQLLQPECQYIFDLELAEDVVPKPSDDEVEAFTLMSVAEVQQAMKNGEFKPNCAVVTLDFFIRHGILTATDDDYIQIISRLHRLLEFPTV